MRRRLWTLATLLLLAFAAMPQPAAAGERAAVRPVKAAPGTLAAPFLSSLAKLGPEMDPHGTPAPSNPPSGTSIPQSDPGAEMDPHG